MCYLILPNSQPSTPNSARFPETEMESGGVCDPCTSHRTFKKQATHKRLWWVPPSKEGTGTEAYGEVNPHLQKLQAGNTDSP